MSTRAAAARPGRAGFRWLPSPSRSHDLHAGFRGRLSLESATEVEVQVLACSWFELRIDGGFISDGPARFDRSHPQHSVHRAVLAPGEHVITLHVHHLGVETRMLPNFDPFVWVRVLDGRRQLDVAWRCSELDAYAATGHRASPWFGWLEWCDTRLLPEWTEPGFDDAGWAEPVAVRRRLPAPRPLETAEVQHFTHHLQPQGEGLFREDQPFYELDDPPLRFFTSALDAPPAEADGVWRRYDLGRVSLGRPRLLIDAPAGARVEIGCSEVLSHGQVAPVWPGSLGRTCTLDHYLARGGVQEYMPLHPKGMRYLEVHVKADPAQVRFVSEEFVERGYYATPAGSFACDDPVLDGIWAVGVETLRACAEDAIIDCPTRERGQWIGDVATVGMEIASVAFSDLRLFARALRQGAWTAAEDGMVSGLCPGTVLQLSSYALQWVSACVRYHELTGDRALLDELFGAACANIDAFTQRMGPSGLDVAKLPWNFIDWGYVPRPEGGDVAVDLHALLATRDLFAWAATLERSADVERFRGFERALHDGITGWLETTLREHGWDGVGYHCTTLALRAGLIDDEREREAVTALKDHLLRCFPNDPAAPRLPGPETRETRLITPYFSHYALGELIERGEMEFVLDQYRRCWGWMLDQGATTWFEVFDPRWSRCHQWSGCPTWQLSRHVLGLWPRFDRAPGSFDLRLNPGSLAQARGTLPLPDGGSVSVAWSRDGDGAYRVRLDAGHALEVQLPDGTVIAVPASGWEGRVAAHQAVTARETATVPG